MALSKNGNAKCGDSFSPYMVVVSKIEFGQIIMFPMPALSKSHAIANSFPFFFTPPPCHPPTHPPSSCVPEYVCFLACTVDARLNLLKSLGIGAKHLPLSPLPPTVIQGVAMAGDNGVGNAATTPSAVGASGNCTTVVYAFPEEEDHVVVGYLNEWINAYSFITSEYTTSVGCCIFSW